jgi:nucleotide-binding universal stress UspA family protein
MYKKILVPLDGSDLAECALDHAKEVAAGSRETEVVLITVLDINLPPVPAWGQQKQVDIGLADQEKTHSKILRSTHEYLTQKSELLTKAGIPVKIEVLEEGGDQKAPDIILIYARDNDVDLIIMATHGRSGISRLAFGSVADKVVRNSKIPVMTIVPSGCRL